MLDNRQLIHPVHEGMAILYYAFKFTADTGNQLVSCKEVRGIHRHLFGMQEIRLDAIFLELGPINESAILKFFDNPRAFTAVNTQFFPELALENAFRFRLDKF